MRTRILAAVAVALLLQVAARAQDGGEKHVRADLIADAAVVAGEPFRVAVRLTIDPKWHLSWVNPGASGQPPTVVFSLPDGFTASAVEFPTPTRLAGPGGGSSFVYEKEAVLLATVTPPKGLKPGGKPLEFSAAVTFLACSEAECLRGGRTAALRLPVAARARPANADAFRAYAARVPVSPAQDPNLARVDFHVKGDALDVTITWRNAVTDPDLLPLPDEAREVAGGKGKVDGTESTHTLTVKTIPGKKPASHKLAVVAGYTDKAGQRRGALLNIPVDVPPDAERPEEK
ncbi:MAG TPA: protein-disulfide reductase DsbD domain-containing protein [Humisphaera sp.]